MWFAFQKERSPVGKKWVAPDIGFWECSCAFDFLGLVFFEGAVGGPVLAPP